MICFKTNFSFLIIFLLLSKELTYAQVALADLTKIGVIPGKNYRYKITGTATEQLMVIKLIPNLSNISKCSISALEDYKKMLDRIIIPINQTLAHVRATVDERKTGLRFWGAVIGGVALGVATAAQITAGIALHNSLENAKAIHQMKDAIQATNDAITSLEIAGRKTVIAISALQEEINTQIVPLLNSLSCDMINTKLALRLNQYFSEISLVFGPNLRDPASETLSIQGIARAFNGDFESLLRELGYTSSDLLDVLESHSIRARIIDVSLDGYYILIQIEYPTITEIQDAIIQNFNLISFNYKGSEWMSIIPNSVLIRGVFLSNIDVSVCSQTSNSYICPRDTSSPMSLTLSDCLKGNLTKCAKSRVVNSHVPRYALSNGVVFANCLPISCQCKTTDQSIVQDIKVTNIMMSQEFCPEIYIDGVFITLGKRILNRTTYTSDILVGDSISIDPVDVGSELSSIQQSLNISKHYIDKSNKILSDINPNIITTNRFLFTMISVIIILISLGVIIIWLIWLTRSMKELQKSQSGLERVTAVNSLSSLITNQH
nr:fusion protein [Carollia bat paramyxovirus]